MFKNRNARTAAGAYEPSGGLGGSASRSGRRGGFGPLDPDEAWDARVGYEADADPYQYYEEQELGLAPTHQEDTSYGGGGSYPMNLAATPKEQSRQLGGEGEEDGRGRTRGRSPGAAGGKNPFDDDADPSNLSMRNVSPRPLDTSGAAASSADAKTHQKDAGQGDSPTERRSVFRENM